VKVNARLAAAWNLTAAACTDVSTPPVALPPAPVIPSSAAAMSLSPERPLPEAAPRPLDCKVDLDCGYDPARDACDADPRSNRQPLLVDQGILCYCELRDQRCAMLRVPPVPCESDASCAVSPTPRPHPVAASAALPPERGKPCRDYRISTTCERTNICTMHRHVCP